MNKMRLVSHYTDYGRKDYWDANSDVYAITDDFILRKEYQNIDKSKKIALLIEPRSIQPSVYDYILGHYNEFKYVFTGDDKLLSCLPNAKPIIWGGVWYREENPDKSKLISMVCSDKELCELHKERKRIARKYKDKIDVYGTIDGGKFVEGNIHEPYMYEVVIENDIQDIWFTEKLLNCLANKTIPIYYGARDIGNYFNVDAIIECKSIKQLENKIEAVLNNEDGFSDVYYEDFVQEAIEENYELSKQYENFDTWFYNRYEKEIGEMFE